MAAPCSAAARVQAINFFCTRQTTPQVFSSMMRPSPPPTLMARWAFETLGPPFNASTSHDAAITTTEMPITRTHTLSRIPVPQLGIALFHRGCQHQIEKIQQPDPDDPKHEMEPAQRHHFVGVRSIQERKVRLPFRKGKQPEIANHWRTSIVV